jgi:hypothetical protein
MFRTDETVKCLQSNKEQRTKNKEQNDILTQQNDEVKILLPRN